MQDNDRTIIIVASAVVRLVGTPEGVNEGLVAVCPGPVPRATCSIKKLGLNNIYKQR